MKIKGPAQSVTLELDKRIMDANYFGPITLIKGQKDSEFLLMVNAGIGDLFRLIIFSSHPQRFCRI